MLKSFQVAQLVYDVTVRFCNRYVNKRSRTHDQMVQAARSGVQNIAEGSLASGTSKKTELKLTNVARASLEELKLDYEDYLRQRGLPIWAREDARRAALIARRPKSADDVAAWAKEVKSGHGGLSGHGGQRGLSGQGGPGGQNGPESTLSTQSIVSIPSTLSTPSTPSTPSTVSTPSTPSTVSTPSTPSTVSTPSTPSTVSTSSISPGYGEIAANGALVLIAVASSLLRRQLATLEQSFVEEGGFTEHLYRVRTQARKNRQQPSRFPKSRPTH
jgi:four helix bundle suffix protein